MVDLSVKEWHDLLDGILLDILIFEDGLDCIQEGTCHCDSMRAYKIIGDQQTKM